MTTSIPGAIITVNNDLSDVVRNQLVIQLQITQYMSGEQFDTNLLNDPNYVINIRNMRIRIMVIRNFQDVNNRTVSDVVIFVKNGLASIEKNCFGPPGKTFSVKNLYWAQLNIFDTDKLRSCTSCGLYTSPCLCLDGYYSDGYCYPPIPYNNPHQYFRPRHKNHVQSIFGNQNCCNDECEQFTLNKLEEGYLPSQEYIYYKATVTADGYVPVYNRNCCCR